MEDIIKLLKETFNKRGKKELEKFLVPMNDCKTYMVFADYCLEDMKKNNDVFTFIIVPYALDFNELQNIIKQAIPTDLKNTRAISENVIHLLNIGAFFSISFIADKDCIFRKFTKEAFEMAIDKLKEDTQAKIFLKGNPFDIELIKQINELKMRGNRNVTLLQNMWITFMCASFIAFEINDLTSKTEHIGFFSDRDFIVNSYRNIAISLIHKTYYYLCEESGKTKFAELSYGLEDKSSNTLFYDEYIKLPDYICGALANLNLKTNETNNSKVDKIIEEVLTNNKLHLIYEIKESGFCEITFTKKERE